MISNTVAIAESVAERTLTADELEQGRLFLQQAESGLTGAIKGLSEAQWAFRPAPDKWSIAQIVEHVMFVQERVLGPVREQLANAPAAPGTHDSKVVDDIVINKFPNRLSKFRSPFDPVGDLVRSEAHERFLKNCRALEDFLESTPDLREHALESVPLKAVSKGAYEWMDGYQWILAAAAHTDRHTKQVLEVQAMPNFPEIDEQRHSFDSWPRE